MNIVSKSTAKMYETIPDYPVYKVSPITKKEMEKIHIAAIAARKQLAQLRKLKKENEAILKAMEYKKILNTVGYKETLFETTKEGRECAWRNEKYEELLQAGLPHIVQWYQMYRGYQHNWVGYYEKTTKPFQPAEMYWSNTKFGLHHERTMRYFPSPAIEFRRNFSELYWNDVPEQFQNLFIDMFKFDEKFGVKVQHQIRYEMWGIRCGCCFKN
jgi:hypothetical protein